MTQPKYAPIRIEEKVRPFERLAPPRPWRPHRPSEHQLGDADGGDRGVPGPDQGYALLLAETMKDRLVLFEGERAEDVLAGASVVAMKRAALFGRAPVLADIEFALTLFGYLTDRPAPGLVAARRELVSGASRHYAEQRRLADAVDEATLCSSTAEPQLFSTA